MNDSANTGNKVQDVICQFANKGKFFEFRDALNPAYLQDYAMIHGIGGKDHASNSGIRAWITDYSKGKGASINVYALIKPEILEQVRSVCEFNLGSVYVDDEVSRRIDYAEWTINRVSSAISSLLAHIHLGLKGVLKGKLDTITMTGKSVAEVREEMDSAPLPAYQPQPLGLYKDYSYEQTRVFPADGRPDGKYTVQTLSIVRRQYRGSDDKRERSKMQWLVSISNFYASPKIYDNGTTSYIPSTTVDKKDAFVQLSDADMYSMCYRVNRFVEVWENAFAIPLVKKGREERQSNKDQNSNGGLRNERSIAARRAG